MKIPEISDGAPRVRGKLANGSCRIQSRAAFRFPTWVFFLSLYLTLSSLSLQCGVWTRVGDLNAPESGEEGLTINAPACLRIAREDTSHLARTTWIRSRGRSITPRTISRA